MWLFYAVLSAVFASLTAILAKVGLEGIDSTLATAIRTGVVLLLSWLMVFLVGGQRDLPLLTKNNLIFLGLSGLATGFSWLCYYRALQIGRVSQVAPVDKLSVILTIALSVIFLHEPLTAKTIIGAGLLAAGLLVLI
ncbi:MAG: EamA family transporter [Candidatus Adiutrix sp.]|nr:EamA family transporter [Candidatus Adiutrix sp.]